MHTDVLPATPLDATVCAACGAAFHCGVRDAEPCWCTRLPPLETLDAAAGCFCPQCLAARVGRVLKKGDTSPLTP